MKKIFLFLVLILLFTVTSAHSNIVMQPYLMGVQSNSVWVLVECSTQDTVTVQFGLTSSYGSTAKTFAISTTTGSTYVHKIQLQGLTPNTVYHYRALHQSSTSADYTFITAPITNIDFRFVWIGDYRTGTAVHDQIANLVPQYNPRFYLNGGDVAANSSYSTFKSEFFRTTELNLISRIPFFLATGNHETWDVNTKAFTKGLTVQSGTEDYYSFDYGNIHFVVINNLVAYTQGSPQYNFAMADLSSANKPWKVVVSHFPAYCSGGHGEDAAMITMSQNIFVPNHVDLVISGHSHFYQHNRVSGIEHLVLGGGGAPLYDPTNASYTLKSIKDYNFAIIDVIPNNILFHIYNNTNTLLDTIRINKNTNSITQNNLVTYGFELSDIYPNPANPEFNITYEIDKPAQYKIELFDIAGRRISTIKNRHLAAGKYTERITGLDLSSGVYFLMLSSNKNYITKRISIIR